MSKPNGLALALRRSGATVAAVTEAPPEPTPVPAAANVSAPPVAATRPRAVKPPAPSRQALASFTVHFPPEVRRQVKMLAAEQGRTMDDLVAEALNLVFVKYRKPEVAPRKNGTAA